jgi:hypothetical protein
MNKPEPYGRPLLGKIRPYFILPPIAFHPTRPGRLYLIPMGRLLHHFAPTREIPSPAMLCLRLVSTFIHLTSRQGDLTPVMVALVLAPSHYGVVSGTATLPP